MAATDTTPTSAAVADKLLDELTRAHIIIRNALAVMTTAEKIKWGQINERDGVSGSDEGITRANDRRSVILQAGGHTR